MSGGLDPTYVRARTALLDAAAALAPHLDAVVLVGAQAIYLHTGEAELAVAEFTTDADFGVEPRTLAASPLLDVLLRANGFTPREHPGGWLSPEGVYVDIMVPEALAGPGRRGADLGVHGRRAARRAKGLEGALVDREPRVIAALDERDDRTLTMNVAGPGALLVAKLHKIAERTSDDDRVKDKDSLDMFRLLRAITTEDLVRRLTRMTASADAAAVTSEAIDHLRVLFSEPRGRGIRSAVAASTHLIDPDEVSLALTTLTADLLDALGN
jgi:hypothetical protein